MTSKSKARRVLVLPDIHIPVEDRLTMRAVERYISDHKWDEVVILGDMMDLNVISSHNKNNLRAVEGQSLAKDYDAGNRFLDNFQKITDGAKITYVEGNHEFRADRLVDAQPQLEGVIEVPVRLNLEHRGINWVPYWSKGTLYTIGKANFGHGLSTAPNHAKKHLEVYGMNFFYGDTHDVQSASKSSYGDNNTIIAQSFGCLCSYQQSYLRGKPTKWQQAYGVFHFRPDGFFNYTTTLIFNHAFMSPEGGWYDGKKR